MNRPLIISGPPRSGTTLLYALFDGHPEVFWMVSEGFLFEYLFDLGEGGDRMLLAAASCDVDTFIEGIRDKEVMPHLADGYRQDLGTTSRLRVGVSWDEKAFRCNVATGVGGTVQELWNRLVVAYAAAMGKQQRLYACMKAPDHGKSAASVAQYFPEGRVLVIVREPVYILNSLKRSREMRAAKRITWPALATAVAELNAMAERVDRLPEGQVKWIRYEQLVEQPAAVMRTVADWLGISFSASLLRPTILGHDWPGHSSFAPTMGIETTPRDRPVEALSQQETDFVQRFSAPYKNKFYS